MGRATVTWYCIGSCIPSTGFVAIIISWCKSADINQCPHNKTNTRNIVSQSPCHRRAFSSSQCFIADCPIVRIMQIYLADYNQRVDYWKGVEFFIKEKRNGAKIWWRKEGREGRTGGGNVRRGERGKRGRGNWVGIGMILSWHYRDKIKKTSI